MKKLMSILLTIAMVATLAIVPVSAETTTDAWDGTVATGFAGGDGSEANPYKIANAGQLAYLAKSMWDAYATGTESDVIDSTGELSTEDLPLYNAYTDKYFELTADIDLNDIEWTPIGSYAVRFNGNFNGNGHVIKNLKIANEHLAMGLFGAIGYKATIKRLGLENANVTFTNNEDNTMKYDYTKTGKTYNWRTYGAGAFIGVVGGGTISECYAKDVVVFNQSRSKVLHGGIGAFIGSGQSIENFGGTVNANNATTVKNCYVKDASISSYVNDIAGAFAGNSGQSNTVSTRCSIAYTNCYAGGDLSISSTNDYEFSRKDSLAGSATDCYTAIEAAYHDSRYYNVNNVATAAEMSATMTALGYFADEDGTNDGWPVLGWEIGKDVWDGTTASGFGGGSGQENDPYIIANGAQLAYLAKSMWDAYAVGETSPILAAAESSTASIPVYNAYTGVYFKLNADISLANIEWKPIGNYHIRFNGNFDGNGHVISKMKITTQWTGIGLFGATGYAVNIKKLGLEDVTIAYAGGAGSSNTTADETLAGVGASDRTLGAAAFIGIIGGGTVENCYAKNVSYSQTGAKMQCEGGFIGVGASAENYTGTVNTYNKTYVKNCYIADATINGDANTCRGAFLGNATYHFNWDAVASSCDIAFENCYVGGNTSLSTGNYNSNFGYKKYVYKSGLTPVTNCYSVVATSTADYPLTVTVAADAAAMAEELVGNGYVADNVGSPLNGGYPILPWEKTWTKAYEAKAVATADGAVTSVTLAKNEAVDGTVIVAVYDGTRFVNAVTATAANGNVTVTGLTVSAGNTVKVFVWDSLSGLVPLAEAYATTL